MYKKGFWVSLESAHPLDADAYSKKYWEERIQEELEEINRILPQTKKVWVTVE